MSRVESEVEQGRELGPAVGNVALLDTGSRAPRGRAYDSDPGFSIRRFKLEAAVLLLLIATFAAIQFQDLFTSSHILFSPANLSVNKPYWYGDQTMGGNSTVEADGR